MSNLAKNLFENDNPISLTKIAASLFGLVLIRAFLEFFSNTDKSGYIFGWETTYLHFPLFYFALFLSFTLVLFFFTKKTFVRIWNFLLPTFVLILVPPVIDLFAKTGESTAISYVATEPQNFISLFFKFLRFAPEPGITLGIRVAAFLMLSLLALFILKNTKNYLKAAAGAASAYFILFFLAIIPSIVALPYLWRGPIDSAKNLYNLALNHGLIQTTRQALPLTLTSIQQQNFFHAIFMAQAFWLLVVFQLFLIFIVFNSKNRKIFLDNFPFTRVAYWTIIALIGIFLSQRQAITVEFFNFTTLVSFGVVFLLGVLNTLFAVCINDAEDMNIDIISNPNRPLVSKEFSLSEWNKLTLTLLFLIILGLATMNSTMSFFFVLTQMIYYLYSAKPLRFKRHFLSSSIMVGLASVSVALAGFFFTSANQHLSAFPLREMLLIAFSFALLSNMKDIKDYEGDKHEGMQTLPVVFGINASKIIIAVLYAIVFVSIPIILDMESMLLFSILCTLFTTYLFTKKQYQEKYIFLTLFLYAMMLFVSVLQSPSSVI